MTSKKTKRVPKQLKQEEVDIATQRYIERLADVEAQKIKLNHIQKEVEELDLTLQRLEWQAKSLALSEEVAQQFVTLDFSGFPVTSLKESLELDHGRSNNKFTMKEFEKKFEIHNEYCDTVSEFKDKYSELKVATIDGLLSAIKWELGE